MKNFEDFEAYVRNNGQSIHEEIANTANSQTEKQNFDDPGEEVEFYHRAFTENRIMIMLRHYHNWLNS